MRVRAQDQNGDYTFGQGSANFLVNSPQAVMQAVLTGLKLLRGEWFLNTSAGMPWLTQVIGVNTQSLYDAAIKAQILSTIGVTAITNYSSSLNTTTRSLTVRATITTAYGNLPIVIPFVPNVSNGFGVGGFGVAPFGE